MLRRFKFLYFLIGSLLFGMLGLSAIWGRSHAAGTTTEVYGTTYRPVALSVYMPPITVVRRTYRPTTWAVAGSIFGGLAVWNGGLKVWERIYVPRDVADDTVTELVYVPRRGFLAEFTPLSDSKRQPTWYQFFAPYPTSEGLVSLFVKKPYGAGPNTLLLENKLRFSSESVEERDGRLFLREKYKVREEDTGFHEGGRRIPFTITENRHIWAADRLGRVYRYDGHYWVRTRMLPGEFVDRMGREEGEIVGRINAMASSPHGIWVGSDQGVYYYSKRTKKWLDLGWGTQACRTTALAVLR